MIAAEMFNAKPCPVCGNDLDPQRVRRTTLRSRGHTVAWSQCQHCKCWSRAERYDLETEVQHTRTTAWGRQPSGLELNEYKSRMFRSVLRLLDKYAQPSGNLLDVGCSYGGFILMARELGYQVSGMDIVPEAVQYVRDQGIPCEAKMSVADLDRAERHDIVSVLDCNCYWPDHRRELRSIREKLNESGLLILRIPSKAWMLNAGLAVRRWLPTFSNRICARAVNDHRVCMSMPEYLQVLELEDFEVLSASPKGAVHGDRSNAGVRLIFLFGSMVWRLIGYNLAPGFLILCRKRTREADPLERVGSESGRWELLEKARV